MSPPTPPSLGEAFSFLSASPTPSETRASSSAASVASLLSALASFQRRVQGATPPFTRFRGGRPEATTTPSREVSHDLGGEFSSARYAEGGGYNDIEVAPDEKHVGNGAIVLGSGKEVSTTRAFLCEGEAGGSLCGGFLSDGIRVCIKKTTRKKDGTCGTISHAKKGPLVMGHLYIRADGHKRAPSLA